MFFKTYLYALDKEVTYNLFFKISMKIDHGSYIVVFLRLCFIKIGEGGYDMFLKNLLEN